ncbi:hypothetical protein BH23GEM6_BH23GEM6_27460 [soil metagenome]
MTDSGKTGWTSYLADAIIVLGGGVGQEGELPPVSRTRVRRAVELFEQGVAPRLILSGRCGLSDVDPPITEAAAMAAYAWNLGVPSPAILLEEESRDTLGNAFFTRERHLVPNGWRTVRVVTSDFHLSRAAWVFRKVLGNAYDFSFASAASGLSPQNLIFRALEECKISIFLNEWLETLQEGDQEGFSRLMTHEHPGYAEAPTLTLGEMRRRLDEIAHINSIAGGDHWIAAGASESPRKPGWESRVRERRSGGGFAGPERLDAVKEPKETASYRPLPWSAHSTSAGPVQCGAGPYGG